MPPIVNASRLPITAPNRNTGTAASARTPCGCANAATTVSASIANTNTPFQPPATMVVGIAVPGAPYAATASRSAMCNPMRVATHVATQKATKAAKPIDVSSRCRNAGSVPRRCSVRTAAGMKLVVRNVARLHARRPRMPSVPAMRQSQPAPEDAEQQQRRDAVERGERDPLASRIHHVRRAAAREEVDAREREDQQNENG